MEDTPKFAMAPRAGVGELVDSCARKEITFSELCKRVAAMGYKTNSLHEMVCAAESQ